MGGRPWSAEGAGRPSRRGAPGPLRRRIGRRRLAGAGAEGSGRLRVAVLRHGSYKEAHTAGTFCTAESSPGSNIMGVNAPLNRKLRMGLVGGGQGAFIGRVHATAAILDNRALLVAGALSSDAAKAKASAPDYDIKPERAYGSYQEMVEKESKLPPGE